MTADLTSLTEILNLTCQNGMAHNHLSQIRSNSSGTTVENRYSAAQKPLASRALRTGPVAAKFYDTNES